MSQVLARLSCLLRVTALVLVMVGQASEAPAEDSPAGWSSEFGRIGTDGPVLAATVYNGDLVAVGRFGFAVDERVDGVARWDGTNWHSLGAKIQFNRAAFVAEFGGDLYVGGDFEVVGEDNLKGIARWDGQKWHGMGGGLDGAVHALIPFQGALVAAGKFSVVGNKSIQNLARWDGERWHTLGAGVGGGGKIRVLAMTVHDHRLVVGGFFSQAGETAVANIAQWDGQRWSAMSAGFNDVVHALHSHGDLLVAGGLFRSSGETALNAVAAWDGDGWRAFGDGVSMSERYAKKPVVNALASWHGKLIVGGNFMFAGGSAASSIAVWEGDAWSRLGDAFYVPHDDPQRPEEVHTLVVHGDELVAGGAFRFAADRQVNHLARWDGHRWSSFGTGLGSDNRAYFPMAIFNGDLVVGGDANFKHAGGSPVYGLGLWTGEGWRAFPGWWRPGQTGYPGVYDLTVYGDRLIIAGMFRRAGGKEITTFAQWDGDWSAMDPSIRWGASQITEMVEYAGRLYMAGKFMRDGPHIGLLAWDREAWEIVDTAIEAGSIQAMTVHQDRLIVAHGTHFGAPPYHHTISAWDGEEWTTTKPKNDGEVTAFADFQGMLVAGFGKLGPNEPETHSVMFFEDGAWSQLGADFAQNGERLQASVDALAVYQDYLVAAGRFDMVGEKRIDGIAFWSGREWRSIVGGVDGQVLSLVAETDRLWCSGRFYNAGGKPSLSIARWDGPLPDSTSPEPTVEENEVPSPRPGRESPVIFSSLTNPGFVQWDDELPRGWSLVDKVRCQDPDSLFLPLPDGGISLNPKADGKYGCHGSLRQYLRVQPGRYYRLRVLARGGRTEPRGSTWFGTARLSFHKYYEQVGQIGEPRGTATQLSGSEFTWHEAVLRCPEGSEVASIALEVSGKQGHLEIKEVRFEEAQMISVDCFDQLVVAMEARYTNFDRCPVSWTDLVDEFRPLAAESRSRDDFMGVLQSMLVRVGDPFIVVNTWGDLCVVNVWRVPVEVANTQRSFRPPQEISDRLMDFDGRMGWLPGDICYLYLNRSGALPRDDRLKELRNARGIILDLRRKSHDTNLGGTDPHERLREFATSIASAGSHHYGSKQVREAETLTAFAEPEPLRIDVPRETALDVPVIALIGRDTYGPMAELALILKALPNVTLIGQSTRRAAGSPEMVRLPISLNVSFPKVRFLHPDGRPVDDDHGIEADVRVAADSEGDPVFDEGLLVLRKKITELKQ